MTEMFGEAWSPMSVPDLAPDDDDASPSPLKFYCIGLFKELDSFLFKISSFCKVVKLSIEDQKNHSHVVCHKRTPKVFTCRVLNST